jgi:hypothetical protein
LKITIEITTIRGTKNHYDNITMTNETTQTAETTSEKKPVKKEVVLPKEGTSAEKLAKAFAQGKDISAFQLSRLALYSILSLSGAYVSPRQLPAIEDIIDAQIGDDEKYVMCLRAGRCGTWLEEQRIMCQSRVQLAHYLLKAQTNSLISSIEREALNRLKDDGKLMQILANTRKSFHRLDVTPEPLCTEETRARVLRDVTDNILYIIALDYAVEQVAIYMKMPAVNAFEVSLQNINTELQRVSGLENIVRQYAPIECLDLPADYIAQALKRITPETKRRTRQVIRDLTVFDGCLVFSPSAPLLKAIFMDMRE